VDENHSHIDPFKEDLKLASLCINYLNLPSFLDPPTEQTVLNGDYGFMDYAVLNWVRHLEAGIVEAAAHDLLMREVVESLENFINHHWNSPTTSLGVPKKVSEKMECFTALPFYDKLEQAVVSTRRQSKFFGEIKNEEVALNLVGTVQVVRRVLERVVSSVMGFSDQALIETDYGLNRFKCPRFSCKYFIDGFCTAGERDEHLRDEIETRYGSNHFKCSRFSCKFFTNGFSTGEERDRHVEKHERPFRCTDQSCPSFTFGFSSAAKQAKHIKETHSAIEFPTDYDVENSKTVAKQNTELQTLAELPVVDARKTIEPEQEPEEDSEPEPQYFRQKRVRLTEFKCDHCSRVFTKRYNLESHLRTHLGERPFKCQICGRAFARSSDHVRHMKKHSGERAHVCQGILQNGTPWGCGKSFSRADILGSHHKSKAGIACLRPLLQEQEATQARMLEPTNVWTLDSW
jgi:hypothetical protein